MKISIEHYDCKIDYVVPDGLTGAEAIDHYCDLLVAIGYHRDTIKSALKELADDSSDD